MIRKIKRPYFEIWGNEEAQNIFLKGLLFVLSLLFAVQSGVLALVSLRKPVLVAVGTTETRVLTLRPPAPELLEQELRRWAWGFVQAHYNWDFNTVEQAFTQAEPFVSEKFIATFRSANADQLKLAKEKKVSEKVYLSGEIRIDPKNLTARVTLDRIFTVEGLRATSPLTLDIGFEYGARTQTNPEGIYVTSEKMVSSSERGV